MSTPTTRRPSRTATQSPSVSRSASQSSRILATERSPFSVEPRSDVLRSALEARRAKDGPPTPSPVETRPVPHRTASSITTPTTAFVKDSSDDPWLDHALSEDSMPHVTPIRRGRRPSEGGLPRVPTQREQQVELEAMKTKMFNMSLQNELLKKQNNEFKDQLEEANKRILELEPLEDENVDLQEANNRLILKTQNMEEEMVNLDEQNREILQIQEEIVQNMEKQRVALEEAADLIIQLEQEKESLEKETLRLKAKCANTDMPSRDSEEYHEALDGQAKEQHPSRISSIDESRPSTSHFDSDYYSQPASQPASPQIKVRPSKDLLSFADRATERANKFKRMSVDSRRSMHDLKQRLSDASIKKVPLRSNSHAPEVPKIPEIYSDTYHISQPPQQTTQTPSQRHTKRQQRTTPLSTSMAASSTGAASSQRTPTTPAPNNGLRTLFRESQPAERPPLPNPPSSYKTPTKAQSSRYSDTTSPSIAPPQRNSSRYAQTSSNERLGVSSIDDLRTETPPSEYPESLPPPSSIISEDLTSVPDSQKWWKDVGGIRSAVIPGTVNLLSRNPSGAGARTTRPPQAAMEPICLFNPSEDQEQFIRRAFPRR